MGKNIVIIGGGISGLSLLHYLKTKYYFRKDVTISLLEENDILGGTVYSVKQKEVLFETGPNGFLDNRPQTLQLIKDLGLDPSISKARDDADKRFVSLKNKLYKIPTNPKEFIFSSLFNPIEKLRLLFEFLIPRGKKENETVYDFGRRRFGKGIADKLLDPMVKGIYGGNAQELCFKEAFPRIYELEQTHGSLFKAMARLKKEKKSLKGNLSSFKGGMSEIIDALALRYQESIKVNENVLSVQFKDGQWVINSHANQYKADEVFLSTPAFVSSALLKPLNEKLAALLGQIYYAPIILVGFLFKKTHLEKLPEGFGYLIPSSEEKEVLGVLHEHNIWTGRVPDNFVLLRVMVGGAKHPKIFEKSKIDLMKIAMREIHGQFKCSEKPVDTFFVPRRQAIPQYDLTYAKIKPEIETILKEYPTLHLNANYWRGVAFNDCIENAYLEAQKSNL